ncbi:MAG: 3'-5' exonuclease [Bacteroidaceae bacterium]|nr:3'-5' exonuclease [Bacteroidaceae bacterium]MBO4592772.1 3'-5' exonuclease [Bacteroidaceae bacterium]MBR4782821.1 3'-5' exonuclease [Bacteroidaceae bacterium]
MKLNLSKPLVIFDLETTGTSITHDRIVEISYILVEPNGNEHAETLRINPGMPIPKEATEVHGITDEDVKDCPQFKDVAQELANRFKGCDYAGFNSNHFDLPLLVEEMLRAGVNLDLTNARFVDVQNIFHKMERRTLIAAYKFYCNKDLEGAHAAANDTQATYEVLQAQLDHYGDELKNDIEWLAEFSRNNRNADLAGRLVYNDANEIVFNFGKYKGMRVSDIFVKDPGYYSWIQQGDFAQSTKNVLAQIKLNASNMVRNNSARPKDLFS